MTKHKIFLTTTAIVVFLDQITKFIIRDLFLLHQSIEIIPGIFNITYIRNPGAAFGMFRDGSELFRQFFLVGASIITIGIIAYFYFRISDGFWVKLGISLIAGGAIGNLTDRIIFGEVIDFMDVYLRDYHWPAFNVADFSITGGVAITIYTLYMPRKVE